MRERDVTIKSFLNSSVACVSLGTHELYFPKMHSENGKRGRGGRNSEWYSVLTFINSTSLKFLEQTGTLLCLGILSFPTVPKQVSET